MVLPGQFIADLASGEGGFDLHSGENAGDLRNAQIAKGLADQGMSVGMEAAMGLHAGFNGNGVGLNLEGTTARPEGYEPDVAPDAPASQQAQTFDPNTLG